MIKIKKSFNLAFFSLVLIGRAQNDNGSPDYTGSYDSGGSNSSEMTTDGGESGGETTTWATDMSTNGDGGSDGETTTASDMTTNGDEGSNGETTAPASTESTTYYSTLPPTTTGPTANSVNIQPAKLQLFLMSLFTLRFLI